MEKVISVEILLLGKVFPGSRYEVRNHFLNTFQKLDQTFFKNLIQISPKTKTSSAIIALVPLCSCMSTFWIKTIRMLELWEVIDNDIVNPSNLYYYY